MDARTDAPGVAYIQSLLCGSFKRKQRVRIVGRIKFVNVLNSTRIHDAFCQYSSHFKLVVRSSE